MELGINEFSINHNCKRAKILISGMPLSPLGQGSIWKPEDWQGDGAFHDVIREVEGTNPGVNVVGCPHWIGSLPLHKAHKDTQGPVVFTVELADEVKYWLDRCRVMVFSQKRPITIWAEWKATSLCSQCLRNSHVAGMCRGPMSCKFCDGCHLSAQHECSVRGCSAAKGLLCAHVKLAWLVCSCIGHHTGEPSCPDLRADTTDASSGGSSPSSKKMISEETTNLGITDRSKQKLVRSVQHEAVEGQMAADTTLKVSRWSHSNSL